MHTNVNVYEFRDRFTAMGRENNFSYDALGLLFEYLEECSPDAELDVIAICCSYAEATVQEIAESYNIDQADDATEEELLDTVLAYLNDHTSVVGTTPAGTIVYCSEF
jgi:hypothetical protein